MSSSLNNGQVGHPTSQSGSIQSPCYKIREQMYICFSANRDARMCEEEVEDYFECFHRKKEKIYWTRINQKLTERKKEYQQAMGTYQATAYETLRQKVYDYIENRD